jgi:hypothetical protein
VPQGYAAASALLGTLVLSARTTEEREGPKLGLYCVMREHLSRVETITKGLHKVFYDEIVTTAGACSETCPAGSMFRVSVVMFLQQP